MHRLLWKLIYPFAAIAHKICGTNYTWVNVGKSAWMRPENGYGPLWHHQWFGDPILEIPPHVNLCGIRYRVYIAEGLILFRCDNGISTTQFHFERDPYDRHAHIWACEITGRFSANHFEEAWQWVKAVYGDSFEIKKKPLTNNAITRNATQLANLARKREEK